MQSAGGFACPLSRRRDVLEHQKRTQHDAQREHKCADDSDFLSDSALLFRAAQGTGAHFQFKTAALLFGARTLAHRARTKTAVHVHCVYLGIHSTVRAG